MMSVLDAANRSFTGAFQHASLVLLYSFKTICTTTSHNVFYLSFSLGRNEVLWCDSSCDDIVIIRGNTRHGDICRCPATDTIEPNCHMWQGHSLHLGNGTRVAQPHWKAAHTALVFQFMAHHVHGQLLPQAGLDHKAFGAFVVIYHGFRVQLWG